MTSAIPPSSPTGPSREFDDAPVGKDRLSAPRILLVDDDQDFVSILSENLTFEGFRTISHTNSEHARDWLLNDGACDIILLDWYMPRLSGLSFLREIRDRKIITPVMILTGVNKDEIEDAALALGAVDFIDKTRRISVLLKRIIMVLENAKTAHAAAPESDPVAIGDLTLLAQHCRAYWRGEEVNLTVTEFNVIRLMTSKPGKDFTYREIYDVVHREGFCAGDGAEGIRVNVRSLIRRIRNKFRAMDDGFKAIENYPAFGYRWCVTEKSDAARLNDTVRSTDRSFDGHLLQ